MPSVGAVRRLKGGEINSPTSHKYKYIYAILFLMLNILLESPPFVLESWENVSLGTVMEQAWPFNPNFVKTIRLCTSQFVFCKLVHVKLLRD